MEQDETAPADDKSSKAVSDSEFAENGLTRGELH